MRKRPLHKLQMVNGQILRTWKRERKPLTAPGALSTWPISIDISFYRRTFIGANMRIKATIDRYEKDKAVLILGEDEDEYTSLPPGAVQGLWLQVELEDDRIINATIDEEETVKVKERITEKIARRRRGEHRH